jgi:hypothetical protein
MDFTAAMSKVDPHRVRVLLTKATGVFAGLARQGAALNIRGVSSTGTAI